MAPLHLPNVGKLRLTQSCHSSDAGKTDSEGSSTLTPAAGGAEARTTNARTSDGGTTDASAMIEEGAPYGGTREESANLATLEIVTTTDTVEAPLKDCQTEHPDDTVEVSLTHLIVPWSRGVSATLNLIRSNTSKSPFSSPRPPGSWTTSRLGPDARGSFNIDFESIRLPTLK